jgi:hypothetical protein
LSVGSLRLKLAGEVAKKVSNKKRQKNRGLKSEDEDQTEREPA